jgi:hypothetical protein
MRLNRAHSAQLVIAELRYIDPGQCRSTTATEPATVQSGASDSDSDKRESDEVWRAERREIEISAEHYWSRDRDRRFRAVQP